MLRQNVERPTGWLGTLYDEIASYAKAPIAEIERMAQPALEKGYIDDRIHYVLKHRLPFYGIEREVLETIGGRFNVEREMISYLESQAYIRMRRYRLNEEGDIDPLSLSIMDLPWDLAQMKGYNRAINGLNRLAKKFRRKPTAMDILEIFRILSAQGESVLMNNFGKKSLDITYKVFKIAGMELPKINVYNIRI